MKKIHTPDATGKNAMCGRQLIVKHKAKLGYQFLRIVNLRIFNTVISKRDRCQCCVDALVTQGLSSDFYKSQARYAIPAGDVSISHCGIY